MKRSKRTQTKLNRTYVNAQTGKRVFVEPAKPRHVEVIKYNGIDMRVLVSDGQIINPRKEYLRQKKARDNK